MRRAVFVVCAIGGIWVAAVLHAAQRERGVIVIEGESLVASATATAGPVTHQDMKGFGPGWSGNGQLFWRAPAPVQKPIPALPHLTFLISVAEAGQYDVTLRHTAAPDYGTVRVFVGGQPVAEYSGYAQTVGVRAISLGTRSLSAGVNQIVLTVIGKAPASSGHFVGLDAIRLRREPPSPSTRVVQPPTSAVSQGTSSARTAAPGERLPPAGGGAATARPSGGPMSAAPALAVLPAVDPGPLGKGQAVGSLNGVAPASYPTCAGGGVPAAAKDVVTLLANVASLLGADVSPPDTRCGSYAREISAGVTLGPPAISPGQTPHWPLLGGRGDLMADAMLCLLKDVGDRPQGRIENYAPVPVGFGTVAIRQTLGLSKFEAAQKRAELYHITKICAPLLGCLDAGRQNIVATVRQSTPAWPAKMKAGDYPIASSYSLEVATDWITTSFGAKTPPITIVTPYGQVSAQPAFTYGANLLPMDTPFANNKGASVEFFYPALPEARTPLIDDTYGRSGVPFLLNVLPITKNTPAGTALGGWSSQLGLGGRDGAWDAAIWKPSTIQGPFRPDFDLGTARSPLEKRPAANFVAEAPIRFNPPNPIELLPAGIRSFVSNVELWVEVNPQFAADYAAQVGLLSREGVLGPNCHPYGGEFGPVCGMTEAAVALQANAQGRVRIVGNVHLKIALQWPLDDIGPFDKPFSIPLPSPDRVWAPVRIANAKNAHESARVAWAVHAATAPGTPLWQGVKGLSGLTSGDLRAWTAACLATPPKNPAPPPPPSHEPGSDDDLTPDLLPCNICVADSKQSQYQPDWIFKVTNRRPGLPASVCEWEKNAGCYDLCSYKGTGWVQVEHAAVSVVGPECGQHKPPPAPH